MRLPHDVLGQTGGTIQRMHARHLLEPIGNQAVNIEQAITLYHEALGLAERHSAPIEWARTAHQLALAYYQRHYGDLAANYARAVTLLEHVLSLFDRAASPADRIYVLSDLACVLMSRCWTADETARARSRELLREALDIAAESKLVALQGMMQSALLRMEQLGQGEERLPPGNDMMPAHASDEVGT